MINAKECIFAKIEIKHVVKREQNKADLQEKEDLQMPQIFEFGGYIIFFCSNENKPTEPIHVHIVEHNPRANSTKSE